VRNGIHSLERSQLLAAVAEAGIAMLVATGESDHLVPPSAVARVAERLGDAAPRVAVLPGAGHLSHEEAPLVLLDFLTTFVSDVRGI
jgi:pimeloyl-ACP methyl ester carboxylesterase